MAKLFQDMTIGTNSEQVQLFFDGKSLFTFTRPIEDGNQCNWYNCIDDLILGHQIDNGSIYLTDTMFVEYVKVYKPKVFNITWNTIYNNGYTIDNGGSSFQTGALV